MSAHRDHLSVYLLSTDERVGWLTDVRDPKPNSIIRVQLDADDGFGGIVEQGQWLTSQRTRTILARDYQKGEHHPIMRELMAEVPSFAKMQLIRGALPVDDRYMFSFPVIRISDKDHEWLFDNPYFEPIDTETDMQSKIDQLSLGSVTIPGHMINTGTITARKIQSSDGRLTIDLDKNTVTIDDSYQKALDALVAKKPADDFLDDLAAQMVKRATFKMDRDLEEAFLFGNRHVTVTNSSS